MKEFYAPDSDAVRREEQIAIGAALVVLVAFLLGVAAGAFVVVTMQPPQCSESRQP